MIEIACSWPSFVVAAVPGMTTMVAPSLLVYGVSYFFIEFDPDMTTFVLAESGPPQPGSACQPRGRGPTARCPWRPGIAP